MVASVVEKGVSKKDALKPEGFRQSVFPLLLCTLAVNVLSLGLPVMTLQIYDRILPNPGTGTLLVLIVGVCLAVMLEAMLRLTRGYVIGRSGAAYEHRMACIAMRTVLNADLSKMGSYGIGEHLHRMAAVGKLKDFYNGHALTVFAELAFVPLFFGLIVYIAHYLAIIPAVILIAFLVVSLWKGLQLRHALKNRERADDRRFNFLIESLEGVHTLKSFALEKFFERRYEKMEERSTFENYNVTQETANTFNAGAIFTNLMVASVISAGAWFVLNGMLTTGGLIAALLLSGRMMQPIQKALSLWARYQDYQLARLSIQDLLETPQQNIVTRMSTGEIVADGRVSLSDVAFQYINEEKPIIENVNLELNRGDAILVSGAHGSGKSTLLNLIAGIYPVTGGQIIIDGEPIESYSPESLVKHVGFIRTRSTIFRGTIRDNITCFGQTAEGPAREVAALLNVDKDVAKLPSGFDTFMNGNNTDIIPPGLKQRIAIVRVLATKPRLILFDNADRSLDSDGYAMIYSLLARLKGKATMIIVSEDQNIRGLVDGFFDLVDGRLVENQKPHATTGVRPYAELRL